MTDSAALKQQARATWAAGDFDAVVDLIWEAGRAAAEAAACGPSDRTTAIPASYLVIAGTRPAVGTRRNNRQPDRVRAAGSVA